MKITHEASCRDHATCRDMLASRDQEIHSQAGTIRDLLREAKALLALMEDRVTAGQENDAPGEQSEEDCVFSHCDFDGLRAAVAKAEGEVTDAD